MAGAQVVIKNNGTLAESTVTTTDNGTFSVPSLATESTHRGIPGAIHGRMSDSTQRYSEGRRKKNHICELRKANRRIK